VNFGEKEGIFSLGVLQQLQEVGIRAELYPDATKMKKQMKYADQKSIQFVLLIGEQEMETGLLTLKDMDSGEHHKLELEQLIAFLK